LRDEPITVYGSGQQSRCFSHVHDVVGALAVLMETERAVGEIFNVGNDQETTILALAERVQELTESRSEIVHVPYSEAYEAGFEDMERRVPDLQKIREFIGYEPTRNLDQILGDVIAERRQPSLAAVS
jgi:UDP-glucose 4-epimerase